MTTLRKARPLIENGCRLLSQKSFHISHNFGAKGAPKRSPRVIRSTRPPRTETVRIKKEHGPEDSLPSIVLLNAAKKSGALKIEPEKALDFLRQYQDLEKRLLKSGWEQKLCAGK